MRSYRKRNFGAALFLAVLLLPVMSMARFISIDPKAAKYPSLSPYVYTANNPLKYVDPDGQDIAFNIYNTPRTKQFGHSDLYFQTGEGDWIRYDAGDYGVKLSPVEGPPEGSLLLRTTVDQDKSIAKSALNSFENTDNVKREFNTFTNNCKDIVSEVVNSSGAGVTIENSSTTWTPESWFKELKQVVLELDPQQEGADATKVTIIVPKYEEVKKEGQN